MPVIPIIMVDLTWVSEKGNSPFNFMGDDILARGKGFLLTGKIYGENVGYCSC